MKHRLRTLLGCFVILTGVEATAYCQSATLSVGSGTGSVGGAVSLPINIASGGAQSASLEWSFAFGTDVTGVSVAAGASATGAGKSVACSGSMCLLEGMNSSVIADGTVAVATFQIAAKPSTNPISVQITSIKVSSAGGSSVTLSSATATAVISLTANPSGLTCTSLTINTAGSTQCTVTLNVAAPSGGLSVPLSSSNASLTVPASVTVAAGQTTANFTATAATVSSNQTGTVTAGTAPATQTVVLNLVAPPQPTSVTCSPTTLSGNTSSNCTVTLNMTATAAVTVTLSSANATLLSVPAAVSVGAGQNSASFLATAGTIATATSVVVTATLNGVSQTVSLNLTAAVQVSSLNCLPAAVNAPGSATCTITLTAAAGASGVAVAVTSGNNNVGVPSTVNVLAGQTTGTFTAAVGPVTSTLTVLLTASLNGASQTFTLTATPPQPASVTCSSTTLTSNATSTCTVTLNMNPAAAVTVNLSSANVALLSVPATVGIPAGQSSATFTATAGTISGATTVVVTATLNGASQTVTLNLARTALVQPSAFSCAPATINAPGNTTCIVTLTAAGGTGTAVALTSGNGSVAVPSTLNVTAGQSSGTFTVTVGAVTSNQTAVLTASLNGVSQTFSVSAIAPQPSSVTCAAASLTSNATSTCMVTLNMTTPAAVTVSLSSGNTSLLSVPATVSVAAGQGSATFTATAKTISSAQTVVVTATLNGVSQTANIALSLLSPFGGFSCSPATVAAPGSTTCTITLTTPAGVGGVTVAVNSNQASVTVPATVSVAAGQTSVSFIATVAAASPSQTCTLTATLNGVSQWTYLTIKNSGHPGQHYRKDSAGTRLLTVNNGASGSQDRTCSPGSLATLTGSGFTDLASEQASHAPWPTELGGVRVIANDTPLPMLAVTDTVLQVQCPVLAPGAPISLSISPAAGDRTPPLVFNLTEATPGIFPADDSGHGAVFVAGTNVLAMPAAGSLPSRPAKRGEYLTIYANGLGPVRELVPAGVPAPMDHLIQTVDRVTVVIGEVELFPSFAGLAPGFAGLNQVNVQLSADVPLGASLPMYVKVVLSDGTIARSNTVMVAVQESATD